VLNWVLGLAGAAGLCVLVLLHEAVHLLVQKGRAKPPCAVIVHVFGGVLCGPCGDGARTDFWVIAAGPPVNLILAAMTFLAALNAGPLSRPLEALLGYLAIVNVLIAVLHTVPAWPADAGCLVGCALVRFGVSSAVAARIVGALGALAAFGLIILCGWQIIVLGARLLGAWSAIMGVLLARAIVAHRSSSSP
jgi:hypothetical protein